MDDATRAQIADQIAPRIHNGKISLLLGAGFSRENPLPDGSKIPDGIGLRDKILLQCNRTAGARTTLRDAYLLGKNEIPDFSGFLSKCFTASEAFEWQERIFKYPWNRIYTTNIDNVLRLAHQRAAKKGGMSNEYSFFNYTDQNLSSSSIGVTPIVSIHGTCERLEDGFIFSSLEYARAGMKLLDWHQDLAARMVSGGMVVVGNQLDESDIDSHISQRELAYGEQETPKNWIVMPNPDQIKSENYRAAGFCVIDATAEEFFSELYLHIKPRTIGDIVIETVPSVRNANQRHKAMTWFRSAFNPALTELEESRNRKGILRHFLTGADPDWIFISHGVHAQTSNVRNLSDKINGILNSEAKGLVALHVIGPSGSGKTTAIRSSLKSALSTNKFIYEFRNEGDVDTYSLRELIGGFTDTSVFVFYSAAAFYYAVNVIDERLKDREAPLCLFILEDRLNDYQRSFRQLSASVVSDVFRMTPLDTDDAILLARKMDDVGLVIQGFSEKSLDRRGRLIQDKERGFNGDLLSALFSLTTHENFEKKIFEEYQNLPSALARRILDVISIVNKYGLSIPIDYVAGFTGASVSEVMRCLKEDLDGMAQVPEGSSSVRCRHRVIAEYYFRECISGQGDVTSLISILEFLSRQFTVDDIKTHPLPYRIYKELINFDFLYSEYFPKGSRRADSEAVYHAAQSFFNRDGIFWLHFGRYYRKIGKMDLAIDCFRTGLTFFKSFQTAHSLGTALLEKYHAEGCSDVDLYTEGVELLERERVRRGSSDPYPTTTLIEQLLKVRGKGATPSSCDALLVQIINSGLRYFKEDLHFDRAFRKYMSQSRS
ncbi:SIR2 family protein [Stenotrophomonas maltophilia]|uniref:P-loop NTPase n=1 Tax=Stenotrophomonas maltophilia TaxID=40324 RepID=UPI0039C21F30